MNMQFTKPQIFPWIALGVSTALLLGALGFQYIGDMAPCQMCYWQRHAHKAVLIISVLGLLYYGVTKNEKMLKPLIILIVLAALVSFGLAFWHVGVEQHWWAGPKSCMADPNTAMPNGDDILKALSSTIKLPACSDISWSLFGLSMAAYNAIISLVVAIIGILSLRNI